MYIKALATFDNEIYNKTFQLLSMSRFSTIKEIFELYRNRKKFYMFPIIILLIALIGVTALSQSGLVAFIYPI